MFKWFKELRGFKEFKGFRWFKVFKEFKLLVVILEKLALQFYTE
jgi:hypothetical protein